MWVADKFEDQKKKLIAGIVLTGGGSQLKHLKQLVEYITGDITSKSIIKIALQIYGKSILEKAEKIIMDNDVQFLIYLQFSSHISRAVFTSRN